MAEKAGPQGTGTDTPRSRRGEDPDTDLPAGSEAEYDGFGPRALIGAFAAAGFVGRRTHEENHGPLGSRRCIVSP